MQTTTVIVPWREGIPSGEQGASHSWQRSSDQGSFAGWERQSQMGEILSASSFCALVSAPRSKSRCRVQMSTRPAGPWMHSSRAARILIKTADPIRCPPALGGRLISRRARDIRIIDERFPPGVCFRWRSWREYDAGCRGGLRGCTRQGFSD
jgi:hypothetical protein